MAVAELPVDEQLVDIGHRTVDDYGRASPPPGTVFVNGPAGVFEKPETEYGTKALWQAMAASAAFSALGGGDSVRRHEQVRRWPTSSTTCARPAAPWCSS